MRKRIFALLTTLIVMIGLLNIHVCAENYDSDWRLAARSAKISFRNTQGELIPELSDLLIDDSSLSYDASSVSYGSIEKLDYGSFDFSFSCVDYNYMIYGDGINLPDEAQILSELSFGKKTLEADTVNCSVTSKGYLQIDLLFEDVNFFDDENHEADIYIQYRKKSMEGDDTADFYKGNLTVAFDRLQLPSAPTEEPKDETVRVEVLLPQTETKVDVEKPYILLETCSLLHDDTSVIAGSRFDVELLAKNIHPDIDVENVLMQVETPSSLRLMGTSNTYYIGDVPKTCNFSRTLSFETLPDTTSQYCTVTVKFSYEYLDGKSRKEESITQEFVISLEAIPEKEHPLDEETEIDAEKPYILIEECKIGDGWESVSAGSQFDVKLLATNLHPYLEAENVLMQVEVPEGLRLKNPSNTFYIGDVRDGESLTETLHFQTMLNSPSKDFSVAIKFNYEYVDGELRKEESITQEIVIPLRQSSRFALDALNLRPEYVVYEEHLLYSGYSNMGKSKLYNVRAELQTELFSDIKVLHLGNLEAGEGGSAEFMIECEKVGTYPITVLYSYETELGQYVEETVAGELNFVLPEAEIKEEPVIQYITEFPSAAQTTGKVSVDTVLLLFLSGLGLVSVLFFLKKQK